MEDRGKGEARQDHSQLEHEAGDTQSASEDSAHTGQTARWVDLDVVSTISIISTISTISRWGGSLTSRSLSSWAPSSGGSWRRCTESTSGERGTIDNIHLCCYKLYNIHSFENESSSTIGLSYSSARVKPLK